MLERDSLSFKETDPQAAVGFDESLNIELRSDVFRVFDQVCDETRVSMEKKPRVQDATCSSCRTFRDFAIEASHDMYCMAKCVWEPQKPQSTLDFRGLLMELCS